MPLPTPDPDQDLVDEEGVAVSAVPAAQPMRVMGSKFVAPEADRLVGDEDAPPGQQVLAVPVAWIEAVIEPDGILDDLRRKSVALVLSGRAFHPGMVARLSLTWQYPSRLGAAVQAKVVRTGAAARRGARSTPHSVPGVMTWTQMMIGALRSTACTPQDAS